MTRATAYHEAGHAVAALMVGYHIFSVTIIPEPDRRGFTGARGNGRAESWRGLPDAREPALASIFYSGAGPAAQSRYSHEPLVLTWLFGGSGDDFAGSLEWAQLFHSSPEAARSAVFRIWDRSSAMIRRGPAWRAVAAVAEALFIEKTLEGRTVERLVETVWPDRPDELDLTTLPALADCLSDAVAA